MYKKYKTPVWLFSYHTGVFVNKIHNINFSIKIKYYKKIKIAVKNSTKSTINIMYNIIRKLIFIYVLNMFIMGV